MKKAFSLIELLVSLIIISLVASALIPLVIKKINHKQTTLVTTSKGIDCSRFSKECIACDKETCTICSASLDTTKGFYVNPKVSCNQKPCTDFDSNCLECDFKGCKACRENFELDENKKCKSIVTDHLPSEEVCKKFNMMYIKAAYNGANGKDLCVTKYNIGDNGIPLAEGVEIRAANNSNVGSVGINNKVCWSGNTTYKCSYASDGNKYGINYNPCTRTVCTFQAAKETCQKNGWRLPYTSEISGWTANMYQVTIGSIGPNGLQTCAHSCSHGTPCCDHVSGCYGANRNSCVPDALWLQAESGNNVTVAYMGGYNSFQFETEPKNSALSTRCVAEKLRY